VIPVLLLKKSGLIKTVKFKDPVYVGDPLNAVKIFNEKEVDELIVLDTECTASKQDINLPFLKSIASECFMPLCYGGGIKTIQDIKNVLACGIEKVSINSAAIKNPQFIRQASEYFGSSTIVVSIDYKKNFWGKKIVFTSGGAISSDMDCIEVAQMAADSGAGELLLNSIDRDGTMSGYDLELLSKLSNQVSVPVIACGGAGSIQHLEEAASIGINGLAAGSMFVFKGKHKAVLINYPSQSEIKTILA
jgi:cyclase